MSFEHWGGFILTLTLLIFSVGKFTGWLQERSELRDWKEWRADVERRFAEDERRFNEANHLLSKLTSEVNSLPTRMADAGDDRYMDRRGCEAELRGVDRRLTIMEQRLARYNGAPGQGPVGV